MTSNKSKRRSRRFLDQLLELESRGLAVSIPKMMPIVESVSRPMGGRLERDMWIKTDMSRPETFVANLNTPNQRLLSRTITDLPSTYQEEQKNED